MARFVVIVDGEVAAGIPIPDPSPDMPEQFALNCERLIASLSSDPIIIRHDEEIPLGSTWDGESFTPPAE